MAGAREAGSVEVRVIPEALVAEWQRELEKTTAAMKASVNTSLKLKKGAISAFIKETQVALDARTRIPSLAVKLKLAKGATNAIVKTTQVALDKRTARLPSLPVKLKLAKGAIRDVQAEARAAAKTTAPINLKTSVNATAILAEVTAAEAMLSSRINTQFKNMDKLAATAAKKAAEVNKARIASTVEMLDEIHEIELNKANARAEGIAYLERRKIEERAAVSGDIAKAESAKTEGRLTAQKKAGLDARTLEEIKHVNRVALIHERAEMAKRRGSNTTLRLLRNDLSQFDVTTTRLLRRLGFMWAGFSAATGAAFTAITAAAVTSYARAEQAVARTVGVLAADEFVTAMNQGRDGAKAFEGAVNSLGKTIMRESERVAIETIFNTTEVAEGAKALAQAGLSAEQITESLSGKISTLGSVARFAQNEQIDLAEATEQLTGGIYAAGLEVDRLGELTDKFTYVSNATNASAVQVAQSFSNRAAPAMRAYGQSIDQTLTVLSLLSKANIRGLTGGEQAGIMARFITQAYGKATETWKKYGIAMEDAEGNQQKFTHTLAQLTELWNNLAERRGIAAAQNFFRDELKLTERSSAALRQIMPQINQMGDTTAEMIAGLDQMEGQIANSAGAMERQASVFTNTLSFQFEQFWNEVSALARRYAEPMGLELREIFKQLNGETEGSISLFSHLEKKFADIGSAVSRYVVPAIERFAFGGEGATFFSGIIEGMSSTLLGIRNFFGEFREQVYGGGSNKGFFAVLGDMFAAVGRFTERELPRLGRAFGAVVSFVRENTAAIKALVAAWMSMFLLSKSLRLFILPILGIVNNLKLMRGGLVSVMATKFGGAVAGWITQLTGFKLATDAAVGATNALVAAQARAASANAAAAATGGAGGFRGFSQRATAVTANADVARLSASGAGASGALKSTLDRLHPALNRIGPAIRKGLLLPLTVTLGYIRSIVPAIKSFLSGIKSIGPELLKSGKLVARFAGPIGLVVLAVELAIGAIRGFVDGIKEQLAGNEDAKQGLADLGNAFKFVAEAVGGLLGITADVGASVGRFFGRLIGQILTSMGQIVSGIRSIFSGDFVEGFKKIGIGLANALTAPLRFAISFVIDLVGDLFGALGRVPGMGWAKDAADAIYEASEAVSDFKFEMGEAKEETDKLNVSTAHSAILANQQAQQYRLAGAIGQLSAEAAKRAIDESNLAQQRSVVFINNTKRANDDLLTAVGAFKPKFQEYDAASRTAFNNAATASGTATAQMIAHQATLQAALGQSARSMQSTIMAGLENQLAMARSGIGELSVQQVKKMIADQNEYERQQKLIAGARQSQKDAKIIADALGDSMDDLAGSSSASADAAKSAAEATKEVKTAAELAEEAVNKLTLAQFKGAAQKLLNRIAKIPGAYKATAREAAILSRAMPAVDRAIERQTNLVTKLDEALQSLQSTQLLGTKAADDEAFAFDQQVKALQLQRVDLQLAGATDEDPALKAIDDQISAIQLQAERASLAAAIAMDPLKKKLEETFTPVKELSFDEIIAEFNKLNTAREKAAGNLTRTEALKKRLDAIVAEQADKFANVGLNVSKGIAAGTKAGQKSVEKAAKDTANTLSVTTRKELGIASPSKVMATIGLQSAQGFEQGIRSGRARVVDAAADIRRGAISALEAGVSGFTSAGVKVLTGFKDGMRDVWKNEGPWGNSIQDFVKGIAEWIKNNKGPISYDAQLLRPAGEAMMSGFKGGLSDGFNEIKGWVKKVGPSLANDTFPKELMFKRSAKFLINNAKADADFTAEDAFGDLIGDMLGGIGPIDPTLSFLHPSLSSADTKEMARRLIALYPSMNFNAESGQFLRAPGTRTAAGYVSAHTEGTAADLGTGGGLPTAASRALFDKLKPLLGTVFRQLIHAGLGLTAGGGSFADMSHWDHIHAEWIKGAGFSKDSGKKGKGMLSLPGMPPLVGQALWAASQKTGVPSALLAAISKQESGWRTQIGSPAGAQGLMQLMPATAASLGVTNINDPFQNALGGAKYIKQQIDAFGSLKLALAAYNAGPGAVQRYGGVPPFKETQGYVVAVMEYLRKFGGIGNFRRQGGNVNAGSPTWVGEGGRELWVPDRSGTVISNANIEALIKLAQGGQLQKAGRGDYIDNREQHFHSNASDPRAVADIMDARMRAAVTGVRR